MRHLPFYYFDDFTFPSRDGLEDDPLQNVSTASADKTDCSPHHSRDGLPALLFKAPFSEADVCCKPADRLQVTAQPPVSLRQLNNTAGNSLSPDLIQASQVQNRHVVGGGRPFLL